VSAIFHAAAHLHYSPEGVEMRFSNRRWMKYGAEQQNADARSVAFVVAIFFCLLLALLLVGCGTTALKPEPKLVSSVTSLPPVEVPIPVRCVKDVTGPDADRFVKGVPKIPAVAIDPAATPLQRYYQMKEALIAAERYFIDANGTILACAAKEPTK
jgi:hypothetical protein